LLIPGEVLFVEQGRGPSCSFRARCSPSSRAGSALLIPGEVFSVEQGGVETPVENGGVAAAVTAAA
jgi:hypothetical protein